MSHVNLRVNELTTPFPERSVSRENTGARSLRDGDRRREEWLARNCQMWQLRDCSPFCKRGKLGQHFKLQTGLNQRSAQGPHCYGCWKLMPRTAGSGSGCPATHSLTSCLVFQISKGLSCKWQKCQSNTGLGIRGIVWAHLTEKIRSSDGFRVQRNSSRLSFTPSLIPAFYYVDLHLRLHDCMVTIALVSTSPQVQGTWEYSSCFLQKSQKKFFLCLIGSEGSMCPSPKKLLWPGEIKGLMSHKKWKDILCPRSERFNIIKNSWYCSKWFTGLM